MKEFGVIVVAFIPYILFKFLRAYVRWITSPLWSLPGPPRSSATWLLGNFPTIRKEPFMEPQKRWIKEAGGYDSCPVVHYTYLGGNHSVQFLDADMVREILFANHGKNPRFGKKLKAIVPLTGWGLVTLNGEDWLRHRRIIHPSFQLKGIKASIDTFVPGLVNKLISSWKKAEGKEIDVQAHFSNLTLDIIGEVAFSHKFRALECVEQWARSNVRDTEDREELPPITDRLIVTMGEMIKNTPKRFFLALLNLGFFDFSSKQSAKELNAAVDAIIEAARAKNEIQASKLSNGTNRNENELQNEGISYLPRSLLQALLDAKDTDPSTHTRKFLDSSELRDEVKTFLLAGHDTTATWCYWAAFALCHYPDVQEKVYNDVKNHSSSVGEGTNITVESVERMEYLDAFLKETLRMYPPVGILVRDAIKDETIKGINIPADTRLFVPIHLLHRHPKYWDDPETFKPERWLNGNIPMKHKQAYIPFSDGPRNCIGYQFATIEAKMIVAHLIRQFSFSLAPSVRNQQFTFTTVVLTKSKPYLKVCVRSRTE